MAAEAVGRGHRAPILAGLGREAGATAGRCHLAGRGASDLQSVVSEGRVIEITDAAPLWRLRQSDRGAAWYIRPCSAVSLERCFLDASIADPNRLITAARANEISAEYDGDWGRVRVVDKVPDRWELRILSSSQPSAPDAKVTNTKRLDEISWRWRVEHERANAEHQAELRALAADATDDRRVTFLQRLRSAFGWQPSGMNQIIRPQNLKTSSPASPAEKDRR